MSNDLVVKHFDGKPVTFRVDGDKLTLTMKEAGELLEYKNKPAEYVGRLYVSHKDEFDNDCTQMLCIGGYGGQPPQRERVFTLDGLILLCMFSEQPIAKKVRKWLRKIGKEVAVTGSYNSPVLTQILNQFNETMLLQGRMVQNLAAEVADMRSTFVPAQTDNSFWPTPAQRLKVLIHKSMIPHRFNSGGSFDWYCSKRHAALRGGLLSIRDRRKQNKMPDCVIEPCPENDQFLREAFKAWLTDNPPKQGTLKLVSAKATKDGQE